MMRTSEYFVSQTEETLNWLIAEYGLTMPDGSPIRIIYDLMCEERERCSQYGVAVSGEMTTAGVRDFFGLSRLCDRIAQVRTKKALPATFTGHIKLLEEAIPSQTSRHNEVEHKLNDDKVAYASNSIFELTVALTALFEYDDAEIAPLRTNTIPDVCVEVEGVRWGFECKVSHSPSPRGHYSIVKEGIKQLHAHKSNGVIDEGSVILSVQNTFSRNDRFYVSDADVEDELKRRHTEFSSNVQRDVSREKIDGLFQCSPLKPEVIAYFEDVFKRVRRYGGIIIPTEKGWQPSNGLILYTPWAYAQHTTFDDSKRPASPVLDRMLKALSRSDARHEN